MAAFPQAPIGAKVELYTGAWTDVSTYVYQRAPIQITTGRSNESSQINPSSCALTLNDRDGRFSFNNPLGAYYGTLVRNAPLRVSVPASLLPAPYNTTYLRIEDDALSYASCPSVSGIRLTGSLDVRVDVDLTGYGEVTLAAVWQASAGVDQRCWRLGMLGTGQLSFDWSTAGTLATSLAANSSAQNPLPLGRLVIRATLDASTGNVTFYTAPAGAIDSGPYTQLGAVIPGPGVTNVFASSTAPLAVGYSAASAYDNQFIGGPTGSFYDMELRSGIGGSLVAHPAFNAQAAAASSWTDAQGNTWSPSGTAAISDRCFRYHGEFAGVPKAADSTVTDISSQATASGILRRLSQGQTPLNSPMYRAAVRATGANAAAAYWPCEDGANSTQFASPLPGVGAMTFAGSPQLASSSSFVCSAAIAGVNGSTWTGIVPAQASWTGNSASFLLAVPAGGETNGAVLARFACTGTVARMDVVYNTTSGGEITLNAYNSAGTLLGTTGPVVSTYPTTTGINGLPCAIEVFLTPSGSNLDLGLVVQTELGGGSLGTLFAGTLGTITSVVIDPGANVTSSAIGHIAVAASAGYLFPAEAFTAWLGEKAADRFTRLCTEEGIPSRIYGHPESTQYMGYQSIQTLPALLQECESTDRGMQFEPDRSLGLGYRTCASLYNQAPTATASFSGGQLDKSFASTADDLLTVNDVTAQNADGTSARQYLASGAMSVLAPPNGVGRVDTQVQVNLWPDAQLASLANWMLHVGTDGHDRVPLLPFNLARPETPRSVALLRIGDLHTVTAAPTWIQYDEIDQLVAGRAEAFGPFGVWQINTNAIPAYGYVVLQASGGTGQSFHVDTDGSELATSVSSSATSLSVATTPGFPIWTTNPSDFPFDIRMGGERMTVTNITGGSSPQTFTVTRSVNGVVKGQTANTPCSLWFTPIVGL